MGNVMTNKYAERLSGPPYYGGCEVVDESEQIAIDRLKQIFNIDYANVQPHSGAQANAAVMLAILQPGDAYSRFGPKYGRTPYAWLCSQLQRQIIQATFLLE